MKIINNTARRRSLFGAVVFLAALAHPGAAAQPLDDPARDKWQLPEEVIENMHLKPGNVVADIGAGNGYFTLRFASAVEPGGLAFGLEISSSKVRYMKDEAERLGLENVDARLVKTGDPELEPGSVDVIFLCNAYHHLDNRVEYFKNASEYLKPGGRVVVVDFYKKDLPVGPRPASHKVSREKVVDELREAGFTLNSEKDFLPYQYYLEFTH